MGSLDEKIDHCVMVMHGDDMNAGVSQTMIWWSHCQALWQCK